MAAVAMTFSNHAGHLPVLAVNKISADIAHCGSSAIAELLVSASQERPQETPMLRHLLHNKFHVPCVSAICCATCCTTNPQQIAEVEFDYKG